MNSGMSINFKSSVQTWAGHCVVLFVLALAAAVVNIDGLVSQLLSCQWLVIPLRCRFVFEKQERVPERGRNIPAFHCACGGHYADLAKMHQVNMSHSLARWYSWATSSFACADRRVEGPHEILKVPQEPSFLPASHIIFLRSTSFWRHLPSAFLRLFALEGKVHVHSDDVFAEFSYVVFCCVVRQIFDEQGSPWLRICKSSRSICFHGVCNSEMNTSGCPASVLQAQLAVQMQCNSLVPCPQLFQLQTTSKWRSLPPPLPAKSNSGKACKFPVRPNSDNDKNLAR